MSGPVRVKTGDHEAEECGQDSRWQIEDVAGVEFTVPHSGVFHGWRKVA